MAASSRIQSLSLGSQTVSAALFAVGKSGSLSLERLNFRTLPGDPSSDPVRSGQSAYVLEELAKVSDAKLPTRYAISGQSVFTRFVKLPPMGEGKVDQVVEFEAQQNVPFPINEVIWDYQLFSDAASSETEVALVAIKADVLNQINDQVEDSGFTVETVDVAPMALLNAFRYNYPDITDPCMLIDIGAKTTNLVFSEHGRIFARSIPIGGSTVTSAIAKDFQVAFAAAEEKKCRDGFVALGGAYAEHPDPSLAAMARVARSTMTRLHAEIVRTINYYRSTLGGSQPRIALLCGGGSALPYTKEFFEEKLGLPVDYFNALRNVSVDASIAEFAGAQAFRLGEHVGLALRASRSCPVEIDLEPDAIALRRRSKQKQPLWIAAAVCLLAGAAGLFGYAHFAKQKAQSKAKAIASTAGVVKGLNAQIKSATIEGDEIDKALEPALQALAERRAWPELLDRLNGYFASDVIWVIDVDPIKGEPKLDTVGFLPNVVNAGANRPASAPANPEQGAEKSDAEGKPAANAISALKISGLWRGTADNPNAGGEKFREILAKLREDKDSPFVTDKLDPVNKELVNVSGQDPERCASTFSIVLPLKSPITQD